MTDTQLPAELQSRLEATLNLTQVGLVVRTAARMVTGALGATFVLRDGEHCFYADEVARLEELAAATGAAIARIGLAESDQISL